MKMPNEKALHYLALARDCRKVADNLGAISAYRKAIEFVDKELLSSTYDNLANALADAGFLEEALDNYELAQKNSRDIKDQLFVLGNRADALKNVSRYSDAEEPCREAIRLSKSIDLNNIEDRIATATSHERLADLLSREGHFNEAVHHLDKALALLAETDSKEVACHRMRRASVYFRNQQFTDVGSNFFEAFQLFRTHYRDTLRSLYDEYLRGFKQSLSSRIPVSEAMRLITEASLNPSEAPGLIELVRRRGDINLALRMTVNLAAWYQDKGSLAEAVSHNQAAFAEARNLGLARVESSALASIGALAAQGADLISSDLGRMTELGCYVNALVLDEMHERIVKECDLGEQDLAFETYDSGSLDSEIGSMALKYHANDVAIECLERSISKAESHFRGGWQHINRLLLLHGAYKRVHDGDGIKRISSQVRKLLERFDLPMESEILARKLLADTENHATAIMHLRKAINIIENRCESMGKDRADYSERHVDVPVKLTEFLILEKRARQAFESLQHSKGRRLLNSLAGRTAGSSHSPPTLPEVNDLLAKLESPTALVELFVRDDSLSALIVSGSEIECVRINGDTAPLFSHWDCDIQMREERLIMQCLENEMLLDLVEQIERKLPSGHAMLVSPDRMMANFPLHAVPVQDSYWVDRRTISYIPTVGLLRYRSGRHRGRNALVAGDSHGDLSNAEEECLTIGRLLGATPLTNKSCSLSALEAHIPAADIVLLAVHGQAIPKRGAWSSLLLTDDEGKCFWVPFQRLLELQWNASLVAFSGCSTGVVEPMHGQHSVGIASSAMEAGVPSVLASFWPVDDECSKVFMCEFFEGLCNSRNSSNVDLRPLVDNARREVRRQLGNGVGLRKRRNGDIRSSGAIGSSLDERVSDVSAWAPFALFGNPILPPSIEN